MRKAMITSISQHEETKTKRMKHDNTTMPMKNCCSAMRKRRSGWQGNQRWKKYATRRFRAELRNMLELISEEATSGVKMAGWCLPWHMGRKCPDPMSLEIVSWAQLPAFHC